MKGLYCIGWYFVRFLAWLCFGYKPIGEEHVPEDGPAILAANHQSYFDPPLAAAAVKREVHFFAKQELFGVFFLGWLIRKLNAIPVRRGTYDPSALSRARQVLQNKGLLLIFPEGTRGDGENLLPPKPGIALIAKQARVPIVPTYLYRTNRLLGALAARRRVKVVFGEPITTGDIDRFPDDKDGYRSLAERVMEHIGRLKSLAFSS